MSRHDRERKCCHHRNANSFTNKREKSLGKETGGTRHKGRRRVDKFENTPIVRKCTYRRPSVYSYHALGGKDLDIPQAGPSVTSTPRYHDTLSSDKTSPGNKRFNQLDKTQIQTTFKDFSVYKSQHTGSCSFDTGVPKMPVPSLVQSMTKPCSVILADIGSLSNDFHPRDTVNYYFTNSHDEGKSFLFDMLPHKVTPENDPQNCVGYSVDVFSNDVYTQITTSGAPLTKNDLSESAASGIFLSGATGKFVSSESTPGDISSPRTTLGDKLSQITCRNMPIELAASDVPALKTPANLVSLTSDVKVLSSRPAISNITLSKINYNGKLSVPIINGVSCSEPTGTDLSSPISSKMSSARFKSSTPANNDMSPKHNNKVGSRASLASADKSFRNAWNDLLLKSRDSKEAQSSTHTSKGSSSSQTLGNHSFSIQAKGHNVSETDNFTTSASLTKYCVNEVPSATPSLNVLPDRTPVKHKSFTVRKESIAFGTPRNNVSLRKSSSKKELLPWSPVAADLPIWAPINLSTCRTQVKVSPSKAPMKVSPSKAPVKVSPSKAPMKVSPSKAPMKVPPSKAPMKVSPSNSPMKVSPSKAPMKVSPSKAPMKVSPSKAPMKVSPSKAPMKVPPSKAPIMVPPSKAPMKVSPSKMKVPPSKAPMKVPPSKAPMKVPPSKAPMKVPPSKAPMKVPPSKAPMKVSPSKAPMKVSPSKAPMKVSPSKAPMKVSPSKAPTKASPCNDSENITLAKNNSTGKAALMPANKVTVKRISNNASVIISENKAPRKVSETKVSPNKALVKMSANEAPRKVSPDKAAVKASSSRPPIKDIIPTKTSMKDVSVPTRTSMKDVSAPSRTSMKDVSAPPRTSLKDVSAPKTSMKDESLPPSVNAPSPISASIMKVSLKSQSTKVQIGMTPSETAFQGVIPSVVLFKDMSSRTPVKGMSSSSTPVKGISSSRTPVNVSSTKVPVKDVTSTKVPVKDVMSTKVPVKDVMSTKAPVKDVTSTKVPVKDVTSSKAPLKDVSSTKTPRKDVSFNKAPVKNVSSTKIRVKDVTSSKSPVKDVTSSKSPVKDVTSTNAPVKDVTSSKSLVKDVSTKIRVRDMSPNKASVKNVSSSKTSVKDVLSTKASVKEVSTKTSVKDVLSTKASVKEVSTKASVKGVSSTKASVKDVSTKASVKDVSSTKASVKDVSSTKASVKDLSSTKASVKNKSSTKASVKAVSSTKALAKDVLSTKEPVKNVSSTKAPAKNMSSTMVPVKDVLSIKPTMTDVSSAKGPVKDSSLTKTPVKDLSSTKAPDTELGKDMSPTRITEWTPVNDLSSAELRRCAPVRDVSLTKVPGWTPVKDMSPSKANDRSPVKHVSSSKALNITQENDVSSTKISGWSDKHVSSSWSPDNHVSLTRLLYLSPGKDVSSSISSGKAPVIMTHNQTHKEPVSQENHLSLPEDYDNIQFLNTEIKQEVISSPLINSTSGSLVDDREPVLSHLLENIRTGDANNLTFNHKAISSRKPMVIVHVDVLRYFPQYMQQENDNQRLAKVKEKSVTSESVAGPREIDVIAKVEHECETEQRLEETCEGTFVNSDFNKNDGLQNEYETAVTLVGNASFNESCKSKNKRLKLQNTRSVKKTKCIEDSSVMKEPLKTITDQEEYNHDKSERNVYSENNSNTIDSMIWTAKKTNQRNLFENYDPVYQLKYSSFLNTSGSEVGKEACHVSKQINPLVNSDMQSPERPTDSEEATTKLKGIKRDSLIHSEDQSTATHEVLDNIDVEPSELTAESFRKMSNLYEIIESVQGYPVYTQEMKPTPVFQERSGGQPEVKKYTKRGKLKTKPSSSAKDTKKTSKVNDTYLHHNLPASAIDGIRECQIPAQDKDILERIASWKKQLDTNDSRHMAVVNKNENKSRTIESYNSRYQLDHSSLISTPRDMATLEAHNVASEQIKLLEVGSPKPSTNFVENGNDSINACEVYSEHPLTVSLESREPMSNLVKVIDSIAQGYPAYSQETRAVSAFQEESGDRYTKIYKKRGKSKNKLSSSASDKRKTDQVNGTHLPYNLVATTKDGVRERQTSAWDKDSFRVSQKSRIKTSKCQNEFSLQSLKGVGNLASQSSRETEDEKDKQKCNLHGCPRVKKIADKVDKIKKYRKTLKHSDYFDITDTEDSVVSIGERIKLRRRREKRREISKNLSLSPKNNNRDEIIISSSSSKESGLDHDSVAISASTLQNIQPGIFLESLPITQLHDNLISLQSHESPTSHYTTKRKFSSSGPVDSLVKKFKLEKKIDEFSVNKFKVNISSSPPSSRSTHDNYVNANDLIKQETKNYATWQNTCSTRGYSILSHLPLLSRKLSLIEADSFPQTSQVLDENLPSAHDFIDSEIVTIRPLVMKSNAESRSENSGINFTNESLPLAVQSSRDSLNLNVYIPSETKTQDSISDVNSLTVNKSIETIIESLSSFSQRSNELVSSEILLSSGSMVKVKGSPPLSHQSFLTKTYCSTNYDSDTDDFDLTKSFRLFSSTKTKTRDRVNENCQSIKNSKRRQHSMKVSGEILPANNNKLESPNKENAVLVDVKETGSSAEKIRKVDITRIRTINLCKKKSRTTELKKVQRSLKFDDLRKSQPEKELINYIRINVNKYTNLIAKKQSNTLRERIEKSHHFKCT